MIRYPLSEFKRISPGNHSENKVIRCKYHFNQKFIFMNELEKILISREPETTTVGVSTIRVQCIGQPIFNIDVYRNSAYN
jgi:hypothetical protein